MQLRFSRRHFGSLLAAAGHCSAKQFFSAEQAAGAPGDWLTEPPLSARPFVLWMWMGSNVSASGITHDMEAMKEGGIGGAVIFSLADIATPWAGAILKSPTPQIVAFTDPWWKLVHHAATEALRLGLDLTLHNCAGYESSGGTWVTPELSMQELIWTEQHVAGPMVYRGQLARPTVDPHPHAQFPDVYIPSLGKVGKPIVEARKTYYRDVAVLALPANGIVARENVLDLTSQLNPNVPIEWKVPAGDWIIYRLGHTTTGAMIQPAAWDAMGLECDKMSVEAVTFHMEHVLSAMKQNLPGLLGNALTTLYFDSYEAGVPTWTPKMKEEFQARRGYSLTEWLPVMAARIIDGVSQTEQFKRDFDRTVSDLYRDCYWATASKLTRAAGLQFGAEPYEGPWNIAEVVPYLDRPTGEFWTRDNRYSPASVDPVVNASHRSGKNIISAEAFTSEPKVSQWTEHPAWLKPIGDAAFCAGLNRLAVHHFVHQPWSDEYKPGNVMGQWGIHLGRYQTWWKPGRAWLQYLWRVQAMLQRGDFVADGAAFQQQVSGGTPALKWIHRRDAAVDIFFVANTARTSASARCTFQTSGGSPELYDPVLNTRRSLPDFQQSGGTTTIPMKFAPAQSFFIAFRNGHSTGAGSEPNFPELQIHQEVSGAWAVSFDPKWGGPVQVNFERLEDWTRRKEAGIRYYSGTAVYRKTISLRRTDLQQPLLLDLGEVRHLAEVTVNGVKLGVLWTAPWYVDTKQALREGENQIEIEVTNVWANRLIGDEQEVPDCRWTESTEKTGWSLTEFPEWFLKGEQRPSSKRLTFTTWNYFTKDSPLEPSGLLGPVRFLREA